MKVINKTSTGQKRYFSLTNAVGIGGFFGHIILLLSFIYFEITPMVWFNIGSILLFAAIYVINRLGYPTLGLYLGVLEILLHAIIAVLLVGWESGFYFYLSLVFAVVFLVDKKYDRMGLVVSILNLVIYIGLLVYTSWYASPILEVSAEALAFYKINNLIIPSVLLAIGFYYYKNTANDVELELEHVQQKTETSIRYAQRIQNVLLPSKEVLEKHAKNHFIFYEPRDIVSGDFYWTYYHEDRKQLVIAAIDCTGHGVPGAFMSMMAGVLIESVTVERAILFPSQILEEMDKSIFRLLKQEHSDRQEGMDAGVCTVDFNTNIVYFAGAKIALLYKQQGALYEIRGTRRSIGGRWRGKNNPPEYMTHSFSLTPETSTLIYFTSDGYPDQFGGDKNEKFGSKRLKNMLESISTMPFSQQHEHINQTFRRWKGNYPQVDDVMILGVEV